MSIWENNLNLVDKILYTWLKQKRKSYTTPVGCIEILEESKIYKPSKRLGKPLRDDLRNARRMISLIDTERFTYYTEHLKFEQEAKFKKWYIYMR